METKSKKKPILSIIATIAIVGSGTTIGLLAGRNFFSHNRALPTINIEVDEKDNELYEKFTNLKTMKVELNRYTNEFRPYQLVRLGLLNFEKSSYAQITNTGVVNASVANQEVYSKYIKENNSYFSESLSYGLMKIGWRFYQTDNEIKVYKSEGLKTSSTAKWADNATDTFSEVSFKESWGKSMKRPFIYTLNRLTIKEESSKVEDNKFIVNLSLEPDLATTNYAKQMKMTSELSAFPTFNLVNLKLTLSSDLFILKNEIYEEYNVPYGFLAVDTKGTIVEEYTYNSNISIPSLNEDINYTKTEEN